MRRLMAAGFLMACRTVCLGTAQTSAIPAWFFPADGREQRNTRASCGVAAMIAVIVSDHIVAAHSSCGPTVQVRTIEKAPARTGPTLINLMAVLQSLRLTGSDSPALNWLKSYRHPRRARCRGAFRLQRNTACAAGWHLLRAGVSLVWDCRFHAVRDCLIFTGKLIGIFWRAPRHFSAR